MVNVLESLSVDGRLFHIVKDDRDVHFQVKHGDCVVFRAETIALAKYGTRIYSRVDICGVILTEDGPKCFNIRGN